MDMIARGMAACANTQLSKITAPAVSPTTGDVLTWDATDVPLYKTPAAGGAASLPWADVTQSPYNAEGDGTTDDTTAIQAALNASAVVLLPVGYTFLISTALTVPDGVKVIGGGTIKVADAANVGGFILGNNSVLDNLKIDGNKANQTIDKNLVSADTKTGMIIRNCEIFNATFRGIYLKMCADAVVEKNIVHDVYAISSEAGGIIFDNKHTTSTKRSYVDSNKVYNIGQIGIDCRNGATRITVSNNDVRGVEHPTSDVIISVGIQTYQKATYIKVLRNTIEELSPNNKNSIPISIDKSRYCIIDKNIVLQESEKTTLGIEIVASSFCDVTNNTVIDTKTTVAGFNIVLNRSGHIKVRNNTIISTNTTATTVSIQIVGYGTDGNTAAADDYWDDAKTATLGCYSNTIEGNTIQSQRTAIAVADYTWDTRIINNPEISAPVYTIRVLSGNGEISGNKVYGANATAYRPGATLSLDGTAAANYPVTNWVVANNIVNTLNSGIGWKNVDGMIVKGNTIIKTGAGNGTTIITNEATCPNAYVENNHSVGSFTGPYDLVAGAYLRKNPEDSTSDLFPVYPFYIAVTASSNIFTLNLSLAFNFTIEPANTTAKSIAFSNLPTKTTAVRTISILLTFTNDAVFTYPAGTVWKDATAPVFVVGKKYILLFTTYDGGTSYLASCVGAW